MTLLVPVKPLSKSESMPDNTIKKTLSNWILSDFNLCLLTNTPGKVFMEDKSLKFLHVLLWYRYIGHRWGSNLGLLPVALGLIVCQDTRLFGKSVYNPVCTMRFRDLRRS